MTPSNDEILSRPGKYNIAASDEHAKEMVAKGGDIPAPKADEDGTEKPKFSDAHTRSAYEAGLKVGYDQALKDIREMLSRQQDLHRGGWTKERRSNFGGP